MALCVVVIQVSLGRLEGLLEVEAPEIVRQEYKPTQPERKKIDKKRLKFFWIFLQDSLRFRGVIDIPVLGDLYPLLQSQGGSPRLHSSSPACDIFLRFTFKARSHRTKVKAKAIIFLLCLSLILWSFLLVLWSFSLHPGFRLVWIPASPFGYQNRIFFYLSEVPRMWLQIGLDQCRTSPCIFNKSVFQIPEKHFQVVVKLKIFCFLKFKLKSITHPDP